ncbi:hypothetical protein QF032_004869 [Streptomyces achromogenes]|nr:hypothetical protein [Streptomyces achromogenes]
MAVPADRLHQRFCGDRKLNAKPLAYEMRAGVHQPSAFRCLPLTPSRVYGREPLSSPYPIRGRIHHEAVCCQDPRCRRSRCRLRRRRGGRRQRRPRRTGRHAGPGRHHPHAAGGERDPGAARRRPGADPGPAGARRRSDRRPAGRREAARRGPHRARLRAARRSAAAGPAHPTACRSTGSRWAEWRRPPHPPQTPSRRRGVPVRTGHAPTAFPRRFRGVPRRAATAGHQAVRAALSSDGRRIQRAM